MKERITEWIFPSSPDRGVNGIQVRFLSTIEIVT